MTDNEIRQIFKNLDNFDHAMLVTERDGELRSRPMVIGDYTDDGRIRFITRDDSEKVAEIDEYPKVNVALHGDSTFLSVSGNARLTKDRELIDKSWQQTQRPWFSEGRNDPHVMVLEVIPSFVKILCRW